MVAAVQVFLLEGVQAGLRVGYVGRVGPVVTAPAAEWARREGRSDAVFSLDLAGTYLPDGVVSPQRQVKVFRHATELALADGFAGLRVAADATDLVRTPEQLDAFVRYEHVIDRYMADQPFPGCVRLTADGLAMRQRISLACTRSATTTARASACSHQQETPSVCAASSTVSNTNGSNGYSAVSRPRSPTVT